MSPNLGKHVVLHCLAGLSFSRWVQNKNKECTWCVVALLFIVITHRPYHLLSFNNKTFLTDSRNRECKQRGTILLCRTTDRGFKNNDIGNLVILVDLLTKPLRNLTDDNHRSINNSRGVIRYIGSLLMLWRCCRYHHHHRGKLIFRQSFVGTLFYLSSCCIRKSKLSCARF